MAFRICGGRLGHTLTIAAKSDRLPIATAPLPAPELFESPQPAILQGLPRHDGSGTFRRPRRPVPRGPAAHPRRPHRRNERRSRRDGARRRGDRNLCANHRRHPGAHAVPGRSSDPAQRTPAATRHDDRHPPAQRPPPRF